MKKISLFSLTILIIAAIDNIRNLPAAALFGSSLIFFFSIAALSFLIPTALVSAELSAMFPDQGGVYAWINRAFGKKWAMAAIWLQWINTMVWYPTILSFIAGTIAYLFNPEMAHNKAYLIGVILTVFWGLTLVNLKGLRVSALLNNAFALVGTILPIIFLIILGSFWLVLDKPLQISLSPTKLIPNFADATNWTALVAIMASFLGIELAGVHVTDIRNPQKHFPRAILVATIFIFFSLLFGSLSIAFVLPEQEISLVAGIMQVFTNFFEVFGLSKWIPLLTILIAVGSTGTMINWLISPAKGLLHASEFGFLPPYFTKKNRSGVAARILIAQAIIVTLVCLVFLLVPSVNAFYWFLTALSTELYMLMYTLMFAACIFLHYRYKDRPKSFKIPGNHLGMWITTLLGLAGCVTTIIVSFFPPDNIEIGRPLHYVLMIFIGNVITISPLLLFYLYRKKATSCYTNGKK